MYIMKENTLTQIKNEVEITKLNIEKNNEMVKRIKELEKNRYVREYLSLVGLSNTKQKFITDTDDEIISQIYDKYIHRIDERDTNGIYIYLGTFRYSSTADIVSLGDDKVSYDDDRADSVSYTHLLQVFYYLLYLVNYLLNRFLSYLHINLLQLQLNHLYLLPALNHSLI